MADFSAALGAMRRGLKVRREGWAHVGVALKIDDTDIVMVDTKGRELKPIPIHVIETQDMIATDWEHIPE
jgi:hypothetical protein